VRCIIQRKIRRTATKTRAGEEDQEKRANKKEEVRVTARSRFFRFSGRSSLFFYKRKQENAERESILEAYEDSRVLVPVEIQELRNSNNFSAEDYEKVVLHDIFPKFLERGRASPREFFEIVFSDRDLIERSFPSLSAFDPESNIKCGHMLERLVRHLTGDSSDFTKEVPILELVAALSLMVRARADRRALSMHRIVLALNERGCGGGQNDDVGVASLIRITEALMRTFQFPSESLIVEEAQEIPYISMYHYHLGSAQELVEQSIETHAGSGKASSSSFDVEDFEQFMDVMLQRPMCLWGFGNTKQGRQRMQEREEAKNGGSSSWWWPFGSSSAGDESADTSKTQGAGEPSSGRA